ncbi:MAG: UDP-N-acetylmuramoyl-L-alanyl-D-glutamate--2,6-diaminopimelate ligase [Bacteroidales bacterium]
MKELQDIIQNIPTINIIGTTNKEITSIVTDSRKVNFGSLFVAIRGISADGHSFIPRAIELQASVIVCETLPATIIDSVTYIQVENTQLTLGLLLNNYYDNPVSKLKIVGVTGTNGKTSVATLLYNMFTDLGYNSGLISTIVYKVKDKVFPASHTTPDTIGLYTMINTMVEEGCTHCFMEVSSHAIHQNRIAGLQFTGAIFTNITHDHLDYHKTFEEYIRVKKMWFDNLPPTAFALVNTDDKNGKVMIQNTKAKTYTYSCKSFTDFKCKIIQQYPDSTHLQIDGQEVWVRLIGDFNAYNILAVYATAILLGENKTEVLKTLSKQKPPHGRFECFTSKNNVTVILDYAHTPDALLNVLTTIEKLNEKGGQIITVFGAGGDRDATKRPIMGRVTSEKSSKVIITSDNPRSENPQTIAEDIFKGIPTHLHRNVLKILDRREAIKTAIVMAQAGDIILVAGKGHETYQEVQGVKHHFDDKEVILELLNI